jgi:hypothetical protein
MMNIKCIVRWRLLRFLVTYEHEDSLVLRVNPCVQIQRVNCVHSPVNRSVSLLQQVVPQSFN